MGEKKQNGRAVRLWTPMFIACNTINICIFLSFQLFPPMLPVYLKSLNASDIMIGWVGGAIVITSLLVRPFAGWAMDNLNRTKIYMAGMLIVLLMTVAYGLFPVVLAILAIRLVHGIGWAMAHTGITTITADSIPKARFGEGMAFFSLASSIALAVAPAVALSISFNLTIIIATFFIAAAFVVSIFLKYDPLPHKTRKPVGFKQLYENTAIWPAVMMFLVNAAYGAIVSFIAIYAYAQGVSRIGIFFTVYALILILTRPMFGKLVDRVGYNPVILVGVTCAIVAMVLFSVANTIWIFLLGGMFFAIAFGASQSSLQAMALMKAAPNRSGAANATFFTGFDGGIGFGSVLSGILAANFAYSQMFFMMGLLPGLGLILFIIRYKKSSPTRL